jgi:hypothetical protein
MREVDSDAGIKRELFVPAHLLLALIIGQGGFRGSAFSDRRALGAGP